MTVQELIDKLLTIKDKSIRVDLNEHGGELNGVGLFPSNGDEPGYVFLHPYKDTLYPNYRL